MASTPCRPDGNAIAAEGAESKKETEAQEIRMEPGGSVLIFYGAFEANDSKRTMRHHFINKQMNFPAVFQILT